MTQLGLLHQAGPRQRAAAVTPQKAPHGSRLRLHRVGPARQGGGCRPRDAAPVLGSPGGKGLPRTSPRRLALQAHFPPGRGGGAGERDTRPFGTQLLLSRWHRRPGKHPCAASAAYTRTRPRTHGRTHSSSTRAPEPSRGPPRQPHPRPVLRPPSAPHRDAPVVSPASAPRTGQATPAGRAARQSDSEQGRSLLPSIATPRDAAAHERWPWPPGPSPRPPPPRSPLYPQSGINGPGAAW